VGLNGAGKTTTLNLLTGILQPTSGTINVFGKDYSKNTIMIKKRCGVVTEDPSLFDYLTAEEQLYFSARLYGLSRSLAQARSDELFQLFDLIPHRKTLVHILSKGMKKKLALMCALIHNPDILYLDEPFEGLDPISFKLACDILSQLIINGCTIFLTSHNLPLIENLCTEVAVIHQGKLLFQATTESIKKRYKDEQNDFHSIGLDKLFHQLVAPDIESVTLSWIGE